MMMAVYHLVYSLVLSLAVMLSYCRTVDEMLPHGDIWMDLIEHIQPEKFKFKYPKAASLVNRFMIDHKKINKALSC